ncbi:chlorohydrolase [Streptococcus pneumoniae]|nr:chlorohydrolase [Streptococcus pneumoniae]
MSKHCFEVVDGTDVALRLQIELTWFEEIFEEYSYIHL